MSGRARRDGDMVIVGNVRYRRDDAIRLGIVPAAAGTPVSDAELAEVESVDTEETTEAQTEDVEHDGEGSASATRADTEETTEAQEGAGDERADTGAGTDAPGEAERPHVAAPRRRGRPARGAGATAGE